MDEASHVRVSGPLEPFALGFCRELALRGYTPGSAAQQLRLVGRLSRWLADRQRDVRGITPEQIEQFISARREEGYRHWISPQALLPLLDYLCSIGALAAPPAAVLSPMEEILERYTEFMVSERALAEETIRHYLHTARIFLETRENQGHLDLEKLNAKEIGQFILDKCSPSNVGSAKKIVVGLRSLLQFLYLECITAESLTGAVPGVSGWRGSSVPKGIDAQAVKRLLVSCDRRTTLGRRDFAVLMLLVRLGLRANEVATLELSDIDWRHGEIVIRGKGNRIDQLPLPVEVGDALTEYVCKGRPQTEHTVVFLRAVAPRCGLSASGIAEIVRAACMRTGLPQIGAHRLRHTLASEMLRSGAGLGEIGQLLRHRNIDTTAIYAKVDTTALSKLARPWPGGVA